MEKSDKILLAMKFPRFAMIAVDSLVVFEKVGAQPVSRKLDYDRTCKVGFNIHYGGSGDTVCLDALKASIEEEFRFAEFESVRAAAGMVTAHINQHYANTWGSSGVSAEFVLVGSVFVQQPGVPTYHIFRIGKTEGSNIYADQEVEESLLCIGRDDGLVDRALFQTNFDDDEAFEYAFYSVKKTYGCGDIRVITMYKDYTKTTLVKGGITVETVHYHGKDTQSRVTSDTFYA